MLWRDNAAPVFLVKKLKENQIHRSIHLQHLRVLLWISSPLPPELLVRLAGRRRQEGEGVGGRSRSPARSHVDVAEANPPQGHRPRRQRVSPLLPSPSPLPLVRPLPRIRPRVDSGVRFGCGFWSDGMI